VVVVVVVARPFPWNRSSSLAASAFRNLPDDYVLEHHAVDGRFFAMYLGVLPCDCHVFNSSSFVAGPVCAA